MDRGDIDSWTLSPNISYMATKEGSSRWEEIGEKFLAALIIIVVICFLICVLMFVRCGSEGIRCLIKKCFKISNRNVESSGACLSAIERGIESFNDGTRMIERSLLNYLSPNSQPTTTTNIGTLNINLQHQIHQPTIVATTKRSECEDDDSVTHPTRMTSRVEDSIHDKIVQNSFMCSQVSALYF